jgi:hypothetical protein
VQVKLQLHDHRQQRRRPGPRQVPSRRATVSR